MLSWVAVLRRILKLYGVRSTRELGMALGVPLRLGEDGNEAIPWPVLEMVVADKGVSWDWVLTGRHFRGDVSGKKKEDGKGDEDPVSLSPAKPKPASRDDASGEKPPRIETRELERALLDGGRSRPVDRPEPEPEPESPQPSPDEQEIVRQLEDIKASMERELSRVEEILRGRKKE